MQRSSVRATPRNRDPHGAGSERDRLRLEAGISQAVNHLNHNRPADALSCLDRVRPDEGIGPIHCHMAGLVCLGVGAHRQALSWFDAALKGRPDFVEAMAHRANALEGIGDDPNALEAFEQAFRAGYADPVAYYNRANILRRTGRLSEAIDSYDRALQLRPAYPEALRAGGTVLRELGHPDAALRFFDEAIRLKPDYLDAILDRTNLLHSRFSFEEALATYEAALLHLPGHPMLLNNRGIALHEVGRLEEARACFDAALGADPHLAQAHLNLGNVLMHLGQPETAHASFQAALSLRPAYPEALCSLGLSLKQMNRFEEAYEAFDAALAQEPGFPYARANKGEVDLLLGRFGRGWPDYQCRFLTGRQSRPMLRQAVPEWTGEPIAGARIVIFADQGSGDMIHFVRYLPLVAQRGADVTLFCPARMVRVFRHLGGPVRIVDALGPEERFDYQAAMSSLPFCFRTELETIPVPQGYLRPEADLVGTWAARLGTQDLKIGLCWRGSQNWQADPRRSVPLRCFEPLARMAGVRLISLQLPDNAEAGGCSLASMGIEPLGAELDTGPDAFVDTAALMESLDLIVTCDTSIAHLAGALGRPVWVLLRAVPEWRWMLERETSPWYSSMRLFRQSRADDWAEPMERVAKAVRGLMPQEPTAVSRPDGAAHGRGASAKTIWAPAPVGDIVDKITILRIKMRNIAAGEKRDNVRRELELLERIFVEAFPSPGPETDRLADELHEVNQQLWTIEDQIREHEQRRDFSHSFILLARSVYHTNDRRAALKRDINLALGSALVEEKSYAGH